MSLYNTLNLIAFTAFVSVIGTILATSYLNYLSKDFGTTNLLEIYKMRKEKEARLNKIRQKYSKQIDSAFPSLFNRFSPKMDIKMNETSIQKVESNVIFVDFKNKKQKAS